MSSIGQTLHELPDLFCELDDRLDDARFRVEAASWLDHPSFASVVGQIVHELERGDPPARLRMRLGNAADRDWLLLACLVALDRAFAHVNPKSRSRCRRAWRASPTTSWRRVASTPGSTAARWCRAS